MQGIELSIRNAGETLASCFDQSRHRLWEELSQQYMRQEPPMRSKQSQNRLLASNNWIPYTQSVLSEINDTK